MLSRPSAAVLVLLCVSCYCGEVVKNRLQAQRDIFPPAEFMLRDWPELARIRGELECEKLWPWRHIVVHHSATSWGNAGRFGKYHKSKGWRGLGYHFVIGNGSDSGDGEIEVGYRWREQARGAHAGVDEYNLYGIGICLVGNFEVTKPTENQMRSLYRLVAYLISSCGIDTKNIIRHKDIADTLCPGKNFPYDEFRRSLSESVHR